MNQARRRKARISKITKVLVRFLPLRLPVCIAVAALSSCSGTYGGSLLRMCDQALLQAPDSLFEEELKRMQLVSAAARVVKLESGSFAAQSSAFESAELSQALARQKTSAEHAEKISAAHKAV